MTNSRLALAQVLAIASLAIFSIYYIDEIAKEGGTAGGFLPIANPMTRGLSFQLSPLILSAAAFALSWNKPSLLVSAALVVNGALMVIDGITTGTRYFTVLVLPGPIIGFAYGLAILALGIVKSIKTGMAMTAAK
ncbi:MAG TPA: hypothetical protein VFS46_04870 [Nitrososphaera sp.]|nr:hypothetical protein [Nitrososphaera sp.]